MQSDFFPQCIGEYFLFSNLAKKQKQLGSYPRLVKESLNGLEATFHNLMITACQK